MLTANRTVTLSTTNAYAKLTYCITPTGGGAYNLNVGSDPLKALATNTWGDFTFDGTAYYLAAYGALKSMTTLCPNLGPRSGGLGSMR
jgi:hypothetical protein